MAIGYAVAGLPCFVLIITIPFGIGSLAPAPSHLAAESHLAVIRVVRRARFRRKHRNSGVSWLERRLNSPRERQNHQPH